MMKRCDGRQLSENTDRPQASAFATYKQYVPRTGWPIKRDVGVIDMRQRSWGGTCFRIGIQWLCAVATWWLLPISAGYAQTGDPIPPPRYGITYNSMQIYGGTFSAPQEAGAFIEAEHLKFAWPIDNFTAVLYCRANAARFFFVDFLTDPVPSQHSLLTRLGGESREWAVCTATRPGSTTCIAWACGADPYTYAYQMGAYCGSPSLVFKGNGAQPSCQCAAPNSQWVQSLNTCIPVKDIYSTAPNNFCVGNPIYPLTGTKREDVAPGLSLGGIALRLVYDTTAQVPLNPAGTRLALSKPMAAGPLWSTSFHRRVQSYGASGGALVERGDGRTVSFIGDGTGNYTPTADMVDRLRVVAGGYRYTDANSSTQESYDSAGNLTGLFASSGSSVSLTYSSGGTPLAVAPAAGYLIQAQDDPIGACHAARLNRVAAPR